MTTTSIDRACPAPDAGTETEPQGRGQAARAHHEGACGQDGRVRELPVADCERWLAVDSEDAREGRGGAGRGSPVRGPSTAPNFEASTGGGANGNSPTYSVTVKATDSSNASDTVEVTVNVTNVDEDGMLTLLNRQPVDGVELLTELTDIDGETSDPTWKWEKVHEPDVGLDRHRRSRG